MERTSGPNYVFLGSPHMFDYMVTPCMGDRQNLAQASASAHPASAGLADAPSAGTVHAEAAPAKALDEADWWLLKQYIYIYTYQ